MLRNLLGFAIFAVVALLVLKLVFSLFGLVLGLFFGPCCGSPSWAL